MAYFTDVLTSIVLSELIASERLARLATAVYAFDLAEDRTQLASVGLSDVYGDEQLDGPDGDHLRFE